MVGLFKALQEGVSGFTQVEAACLCLGLAREALGRHWAGLVYVGGAFIHESMKILVGSPRLSQRDCVWAWLRKALVGTEWAISLLLCRNVVLSASALSFS